MSILLALDTILTADADFGAGGTAVFGGELPSSPDDAVALFHTGGRPSPQDSRDGYRITVNARFNSQATAYARLEKMKTLLASPLFHNTAEGKLNVYTDQDIMSLGRDEDQRWLFSLNFRVHREVS